MCRTLVSYMAGVGGAIKKMEMGSETQLQLSGSLPVANVQALAAECLTEIPPRYLRQPDELGQLWPSAVALQIPVIDMSKLGDGSSRKETEMERLNSALKDWGFFQLINHGIPEEVVQDMKINVEEFFKLSLPEKMAYEQLPNGMEGYGQAFVLSEEQKLDWGDMLFLLVQPPSQRKFRFWPKHPASFRATLEKYSSELLKVELSLLRVMAKNLGVDPDMFVSQFEGGIQGIRMNYYPPCPQSNRVFGLSPHSDAVGITLLLQTSYVDGLQIKKEGKWLPIKPVPGALVVNIGDIIEIMSNGEFKSIEHRAVVNSDKERLSIAAFHGIKLEGKVGPLPDLAKKERARYKTMSNVDYARQVTSLKLDGKSTLDLLKLDANEINLREQS